MTAARHEPSMWIVAPRGRTISRMSSGMPIFSAASRLAGSAARELPVPNAVRAGGVMFVQKLLMPLEPAAVKA